MDLQKIHVTNLCNTKFQFYYQDILDTHQEVSEILYTMSADPHFAIYDLYYSFQQISISMYYIVCRRN